MATVEQMTSEITLLRTQVNDVSDVSTYDERAETFEDWLFKAKNYLESEDSEFAPS